jgi:hypothetical protein
MTASPLRITHDHKGYGPPFSRGQPVCLSTPFNLGPGWQNWTGIAKQWSRIYLVSRWSLEQPSCSVEGWQQYNILYAMVTPNNYMSSPSSFHCINLMIIGKTHAIHLYFWTHVYCRKYVWHFDCLEKFQIKSQRKVENNYHHITSALTFNSGPCSSSRKECPSSSHTMIDEKLLESTTESFVRAQIPLKLPHWLGCKYFLPTPRETWLPSGLFPITHIHIKSTVISCCPNNSKP